MELYETVRSPKVNNGDFSSLRFLTTLSSEPPLSEPHLGYANSDFKHTPGLGLCDKRWRASFVRKKSAEHFRHIKGRLRLLFMRRRWGQPGGKMWKLSSHESGERRDREMRNRNGNERENVRESRGRVSGRMRGRCEEIKCFHRRCGNIRLNQGCQMMADAF